jgi:cytochrome c
LVKNLSDLQHSKKDYKNNMKKSPVIFSCVLLVIACNNNGSNKSKIDTTPALSQTNNNYPSPVDTLGFHQDSATERYEEGSNLTSQSDCLGCHKVKETSIGPSYVAIANKYPSTPENIKHLASTIIKGSKGVWGQVPMQPHPSISQEDATKMVNYILSLKDIK